MPQSKENWDQPRAKGKQKFSLLKDKDSLLVYDLMCLKLCLSLAENEEYEMLSSLRDELKRTKEDIKRLASGS